MPDYNFSILKFFKNFTFAFAAFAVPSLAVAANPNGFQWQSGQYNDGNNRGAVTAYLLHGVPETDHVQVTGNCSAKSSGNFSIVRFGADIGNAREGAQMRLRFVGDGFDRSISGRVAGLNSEEGVVGIEIEIDNEDGLWQGLKALPFVRYGVEGRAFTDLDLQGSSRAINDFLFSCRQFAGNFGNENSGEFPKPSNDPRHATCDQYRDATSRNSDNPVSVTFTNRSGEHRSVMWIGFDGQTKEYAALNDGQSFTINTFVTHPWMFTDGPGNCIEMFMPSLGVSQFNISAPGRYFGDE